MASGSLAALPSRTTRRWSSTMQIAVSFSPPRLLMLASGGSPNPYKPAWRAAACPSRRSEPAARLRHLCGSSSAGDRANIHRSEHAPPSANQAGSPGITSIGRIRSTTLPQSLTTSASAGATHLVFDPMDSSALAAIFNFASMASSF
jgi:hypothetical protein